MTNIKRPQSNWKTQDFAQRIQQLRTFDETDSSRAREVVVELIPDQNVAPALFVPLSEQDPHLNKKRFKAHPITIRSLRKDLFVLSLSLDDLEKQVLCTYCQRFLDFQFWIQCPYCDKAFCKSDF
jgi:hypothetical protein